MQRHKKDTTAPKFASNKQTGAVNEKIKDRQ